MAANPHASLGYIESYGALLHDQLAAQGQLMVSAQIRGPLTPELVAQALKIMHARHPLLRCTVERGERGYHLHPDRVAEPRLEVHRRLDDEHWRRRIHQEQCQPVPMNDHLWRATLLHSDPDPDAWHELLLTFSHTLSDGVSVTYLVHDLLACMARLAEGETPEAAPLPLLPPVEAMLADVPDWEAFKRLQAEDAASAPQTTPIPVAGYVPREERATAHIFRTVEGAVVQALHERAHHEYTTVNAALQAAMALAVQRQLGTTASFDLLTPVNMRPYCKTPLSREHFGYFVSLIPAYLVDVDAGSNMWGLARDYNGQIVGQIRSNRIANPVRFDFKELEAWTVAPEPDREHFQKGPALTNLGHLNFPHKYGPFFLEASYFHVCLRGTDFPFVLYVSTIKDRMHLCLNWCTPLLTTDWAHQAMEDFLDIVERNSGVGD